LPQVKGSTVGHAYVDNGTYVATLVVTDSHGAADTATATVSVSNAPPEIFTLATSTTLLSLGSVASIQVSYADPGVTDTLTASVDWGDGVSIDRISGERATHGYAAAGRYVVTVTVRDNGGATATRTAPAPIVVYDPNANQVREAGYDVIDLGTLGGNVTIPSAINDRGQIVGTSSTADGQSHAVLWENGEMHDLAPDLPASSASLITNSGTIAGVSQSGASHLVIWSNGVRTDLGDLNWVGDRTALWPVAMTEAGDLVAAQSNGERTHSGIWRAGVKEVLRGLGGERMPPAVATALDMNNRGQIVGGSMVGENAGNEITHAFIWENGVMRDLGVLADHCSPIPGTTCGAASAADINENGDIVGRSTSTDPGIHAVLWSNGALRDLGHGWAEAINDAGEIVGYKGEQPVFNDKGELVSYGGNEATFWRAGIATPLRSLGGGKTLVVGLNNLGMVIGSSVTSWGGVHVFVWQSGTGLMDLGVGPAAGEEDGALAVAINARGDIIGYTATCSHFGSSETLYCLPNAQSRGILWRKKN
jgi:probable HAF family extracellular repeat protein